MVARSEAGWATREQLLAHSLTPLTRLPHAPATRRWGVTPCWLGRMGSGWLASVLVRGGLSPFRLTSLTTSLITSPPPIRYSTSLKTGKNKWFFQKLRF